MYEQFIMTFESDSGEIWTNPLKELSHAEQLPEIFK